MKKRKIISVGLALLLSTGLLTGCGKTNTTPVTDTKPSPALEQAIVHEEKVENRVYEPFEHVFFKRYYNGYNTVGLSEKVSGGQIEIPEGYEILEIENFNELIAHGSQTAGFDVWFINKKTVEVTAVYNEVFGYYDYSEPGKVLEQEITEEIPTLKKTK